MYTTQSAIESQIQPSKLIQLTDDDSTGNLNASVLNAVILSASNYIDQKIANIYDVPFTGAIPVAVQAMALTITCYQLFRRRLIPDEKNPFYDEFSEAVKSLNKINQGEMMLETGEERIYSQVAVSGRNTIYGVGNVLSNSM